MADELHVDLHEGSYIEVVTMVDGVVLICHDAQGRLIGSIPIASTRQMHRLVMSLLSCLHLSTDHTEEQG